MDRLFTVCYLPVCLLLLGVAIKFNNIPGRPRILVSFAAFTLIMMGLPLVSATGIQAHMLLPQSMHSSAHKTCTASVSHSQRLQVVGLCAYGGYTSCTRSDRVVGSHKILKLRPQGGVSTSLLTRLWTIVFCQHACDRFQSGSSNLQLGRCKKKRVFPRRKLPELHRRRCDM